MSMKYSVIEYYYSVIEYCCICIVCKPQQEIMLMNSEIFDCDYE